LYVVGGWLLPGRKRVVPYSIQTLKRLKPGWFREDLIVLLDLLKQQKLKPLVTRRFSFAEAREAHEMLVNGGVIGKIVLVSEDRIAELDLASAAAILDPTQT
jgi:NADPH2:quinone reductase